MKDKIDFAIDMRVTNFIKNQINLVKKVYENAQ